MKTLKSEFKGTYLIYIAVFAFYLWMAAQIPYTHDDWDWGLEIGMHQFLYATVNSRYVGNFFEIIMTRSELLKVVIMGTVYFLIPYLLMRISAREQKIFDHRKRTLLFLLCNCVLLTMNQIMWRQVYGWVAGFANFSISAIFLMLWIDELLRVCDVEIEEKNDSSIKSALCFVASFLGQLFLENIAIYCFLLSGLLCGIYYFRRRKIPVRMIGMCLGAVGGLMVMFSSGMYKMLFTTGYAVGKYRAIPMLGYDSVFGAIREFFVQVLHLGVELYSNNIFLSIAVLTMFIGLLLSKKNDINRKLYKKCFAGNWLLIIVFTGCYLYDRSCKDHSVIIYCLDFCVSVAYFFTIIVETIVLFNWEKRVKLLALWLSAPILIAPLLVTTEIGQRLFFTSNIFVILFALMLLAEMLNFVHDSTCKRIGCVGVCAAVLLFSFYGRIYMNIGGCKHIRDTIILEGIQTEREEIRLPAFPCKDYLHFPNPADNYRTEYFKDFYEIPDNVEIIFE